MLPIPELLRRTRRHTTGFSRILLACGVAALLAACLGSGSDYVAAATFSRHGFARSRQQARQLHGQAIRVWGYVDHGNLYGDEAARQILQEWWSGEGPEPDLWRFNLKARAQDQIGQSFAVHVPNDGKRDELLREMVADARAGRSSRVYLEGTLYTFEAPTAGTTLIGLTLVLSSSQGISLHHPPVDQGA